MLSGSNGAPISTRLFAQTVPVSTMCHIAFLHHSLLIPTLFRFFKSLHMRPQSVRPVAGASWPVVANNTFASVRHPVWPVMRSTAHAAHYYVFTHSPADGSWLHRIDACEVAEVGGPTDALFPRLPNRRPIRRR